MARILNGYKYIPTFEIPIFATQEDRLEIQQIGGTMLASKYRRKEVILKELKE